MKCVVSLVDIVICLEEDRILRPDDGVRDLEIKVRFRSSVFSRYRRSGTVNALQDRVSSLRDVSIKESVRMVPREEGTGDDLRGQNLEEPVQVLLSINVSNALEYSKFIALGGRLAVGNVVEAWRQW